MTTMDIFNRGKRIYKRLKSKIEKKHKGQIIAIEPVSGGFIIGKDELETALKAQHKFPGKIFDFFRIGYPAVHKFR